MNSSGVVPRSNEGLLAHARSTSSASSCSYISSIPIVLPDAMAPVQPGSERLTHASSARWRRVRHSADGCLKGRAPGL